MDKLIRSAIVDKKLLQFDYGGHERIVETHVYGIKNAKRREEETKFSLLTFFISSNFLKYYFLYNISIFFVASFVNKFTNSIIL